MVMRCTAQLCVRGRLLWISTHILRRPLPTSPAGTPMILPGSANTSDGRPHRSFAAEPLHECRSGCRMGPVRDPHAPSSGDGPQRAMGRSHKPLPAHSASLLEMLVISVQHDKVASAPVERIVGCGRNIEELVEAPAVALVIA